MRNSRFLILGILCLVYMGGLSAQEVSPFTPSITLSTQVISEDFVVVDEVVAQRFGILAIYADDGTGQRGGLLGFSLLRPGVTRDVSVSLQMINVTPRLHAVLHLDTEPFGEFQYGAVEGADAIVTFEGEEIVQSQIIPVISLSDQFVDEDNFNRILVDTASLSFEMDTWVVAHSDDDGALGDILGHTFLEEGTSQQIPLILSGTITAQVHITLHPDTGEPEKFEYLEDASSDVPYELNGEIARTTISTVPTLRINNQIVIGSDLTRNQNEQVPVLIDSVLSPQAGWVVVYADDGSGNLGEVIGFAPVQAGFNNDVNVLVTQIEVTPRLHAVLHEDAGETQVFEYQEDDTVDVPILYAEQEIAGSADVLPSLYGVMHDDDEIFIEGVLMDTAGWVVAYALDDNGEQSEVVGVVPVRVGLNQDVTMTLTSVPEKIQLMLHYDTRPSGVFSFETEVGSDLPVVFDGQPIFVDVE